MYECFGGPMDGKRVAMHEGRELRVSLAPKTGIAWATPSAIPAAPVESRTGVYRLVQSKSQPQPYLRWMGEL